MKKLNPNDLEKITKQGNYSNRLNIDEFVREVNKVLKKTLLESKINNLGQNIEVVTTRTRFGGDKLWFLCPKCGQKRGVLYQHPISLKVACRNC